MKRTKRNVINKTEQNETEQKEGFAPSMEEEEIHH